jgi:hypothetical protein
MFKMSANCSGCKYCKSLLIDNLGVDKTVSVSDVVPDNFAGLFVNREFRVFERLFACRVNFNYLNTRQLRIIKIERVSFAVIELDSLSLLLQQIPYRSFDFLDYKTDFTEIRNRDCTRSVGFVNTVAGPDNRAIACSDFELGVGERFFSSGVVFLNNCGVVFLNN